MKVYNVQRSHGTGEVQRETIWIECDGSVVRELDGDSFAELHGKMVRLADWTDQQILDDYRKSPL
jgi:hypothetical protein